MAVPAQAAVEQKSEAEVSPRVEARGGEEGKNGAKRGRKVAKVPALEPEEAKTSSVKKARKKKVPREDSVSVQSQPSASRPEEASTVLHKAPSASSSYLDGTAAEDEAEVGGRKPLSARAARSAAKPAERWTCRLRHVRRSLGAGRIG
ncbi:hypothetical protein [Labrys neptuniae]